MRYRLQDTAKLVPQTSSLGKTIAWSTVFWLPLLIFSLLANAIRGDKPLLREDNLLRDIHAAASPFLDKLMELVTRFGDVTIIVPLVLIAVTVLAYKRFQSQALFLLLAAGGTSSINVVFKASFHRDRPHLWPRLVSESSYSFPSGHAMISSTLVLAVAVVLWRSGHRKLLVVLCVAYGLLVGFSRLYLGVHYPSDILAGWCVSLLWVSVLVYVFRKLRLDYHLHGSDGQAATNQLLPRR